MLDDIESQWSRELRADVVIQSKGGQYVVYIDGDYFSDGTLQEIDHAMSTLILLTEPERDGF